MGRERKAHLLRLHRRVLQQVLSTEQMADLLDPRAIERLERRLSHRTEQTRARNADELSRAAVFLSDLAEMIRPRAQIEILQDVADNRILECASTGKADVIVTGDSTMLELGRYRDIKIVSLADYLASNQPADD